MAVRILHAHSTFTLGGKEARAVRLMNAFGDSAEHAILSSVDGAVSARAAIDRRVAVSFPGDAPPLAGRPSLMRLARLARYMRRFDLVLSYNWGAFDAVMARRLFGGPPLVHHEDGFNQDEAERLNGKRNLYRRLGLPAAYRLVVPSARLERIALGDWRQARERLERIPNGVSVDRFTQPVADDAIPGLHHREGEVVIGTIAGLRAVKNLPRLVRAFAGMQMKNARLVIVGEGPESEAIVAEARRCGVADRLVLPGFLPDAARYAARFDLFALSSDSEQFPISLVEAMAAG
ncbi:MAG: glycosyl transferase family 1, partial [Alphaproteobacteria bacterium]|nr:glycosyl transferase family 1 [Alphaproteobacteria bacterium]